MRLGLPGPGRIGELHADTLASLPMVDSLVVADIIPDLTTRVADRLGAEPAAYQAEREVFAELVAGDRGSPCCTVEDGLAADLIAEACGLSLREHRPVRIEEVRP